MNLCRGLKRIERVLNIATAQEECDSRGPFHRATWHERSENTLA